MDEKMTERMAFRIKPSSRANIEKVSAALGLTVSEFIRNFVVRIADQIGGKDNG